MLPPHKWWTDHFKEIIPKVPLELAAEVKRQAVKSTGHESLTLAKIFTNPASTCQRRNDKLLQLHHRKKNRCLDRMIRHFKSSQLRMKHQFKNSNPSKIRGNLFRHQNQTLSSGQIRRTNLIKLQQYSANQILRKLKSSKLKARQSPWLKLPLIKRKSQASTKTRPNHSKKLSKHKKVRHRMIVFRFSHQDLQTKIVKVQCWKILTIAVKVN